ncbi:MAG: hypothetical protein CM15mP16_00210 [Candidatus Pelagibacterales bacterium]|nr:MAG: hypothetical protein CM15mP16_00210 [Pelagibacterales bacterium]
MKKSLISSILLLFLVSCAQIQALQDEPETYDSQKQKILTEKAEDRDINLPPGSTIIDELRFQGFLAIGGFGSETNLQVNSITFNVALDKVGFMPLISVDSMSGIIVTDWYSLDDGQSRIKINIRVVDQEMTDESVTVSLFTQSLDGDRWIDQGINSEQSLKIKESILTSARSLKIASEL